MERIMLWDNEINKQRKNKRENNLRNKYTSERATKHHYEVLIFPVKLLYVKHDRNINIVP